VDTHGLGDQSLDFRENRAFLVRPIEHLIALDAAHDESHVGELLDFALQSAVASAHRSDELAQVERLVRVAKEQGKQGAASAPE
jgi:hypothetical protein